MTLHWREGRIYVGDNGGINGKIRQLIDDLATIKRFSAIRTGRILYVITLINMIRASIWHLVLNFKSRFRSRCLRERCRSNGTNGTCRRTLL